MHPRPAFAAVALLGAVFGALTLAALRIPEAAAANTGRWQCYVVDRLPKVAAAAEWQGAKDAGGSLDEILPNAAEGSYIQLYWEKTVPMLCTKRGTL